MGRVRSRKPQNVRRRQRRRLDSLLRRERALWAAGLVRVAGVDEAGVGPLAGPVTAAAVYFEPGVGLLGVDDSKKLAPPAREELAGEIRIRAAGWAVAAVEPGEIDRLNIYQAGLEAMRRAVAALPRAPQHLLIDGRGTSGIDLPQERIVGGDRVCHAIAAASILAKTERDRRMRAHAEEFPGYGFEEHKGYPTESHRDAIRKLGPCEIHRRSFTLLPHPRLFD